MRLRADLPERCPRFLAVLLLVVAFAISTPALAVAQDGYVTLRGTNQVLRYDPTNPTVVSNVVAAGGAPTGVAVSPDGNFAYFIAGTTVRRLAGGVIDGGFNVALTGVGAPEQIAVSPDGNRLFITDGFTHRLLIIDLTAANAQTTINGVTGAFGVEAVTTAAGDRVYVSLATTNQVKVFDAVTNVELATVSVGTTPQGVAASPLGDFVYVANFNDDSVSVIDAATNSVFPIAGVGDGPQELTVSGDGTLVYVTLSNVGDVAVINTTTNMVDDTVDLGVLADRLHGISFSADGAYVVVAHFGGRRISVIDPSDGNSFVTVGPIGTSQPRYVAFQPLAPLVPDTPPEFVLPLCDVVIDATLGVELTLPINVIDDLGATVTLVESPANSGGLDAPFPASPSTPVAGTFRWTPTGSDPAGDYELIFTATDQVNASVSCTVTISVPAPPIDDPPALISGASGQMLTPALGDTVTFTVNADDDNEVMLSVSGLPTGAAMNPALPQTGTGLSSDFSWTLTGADAGTYEVTFTADDGVNPPVSCVVTIVVPEKDEGEEWVEFLDFRVNLAKIDTKGRHADSFWFNGNFAVDLRNGDGIDPASERVVIGIEGTKLTIPAGEFEAHFRGRLFRFRGVVDGAKMLVHIIQIRRHIYNINITGWDASIPNVEKPLELCLEVGDDFGCDPKPRRSLVR